MDFRHATTNQLVIAVIIIFILVGCQGATARHTNQLEKKPTKETNTFNFLRLLIMRLVYGLATMMGFEDNLANVGNGIFVPPGVSDDYEGFSLDIALDGLDNIGGREPDDYYDDFDDY